MSSFDNEEFNSDMDDAITESDNYYELKQFYLELVEQDKLEFYHKLKFRKKLLISGNETKIIACQKGIDIKEARQIVARFNDCIKGLKKQRIQKNLVKLTRQITNN